MCQLPESWGKGTHHHTRLSLLLLLSNRSMGNGWPQSRLSGCQNPGSVTNNPWRLNCLYGLRWMSGKNGLNFEELGCRDTSIFGWWRPGSEQPLHSPWDAHPGSPGQRGGARQDGAAVTVPHCVSEHGLYVNTLWKVVTSRATQNIQGTWVSLNMGQTFSEHF